VGEEKFRVFGGGWKMQMKQIAYFSFLTFNEYTKL